MQFCEYTDLRPQEFRNYGHRNVVNRAALVSFQAVQIGQMDSGNKDDGSPSKAWVFADHFRQLEAIHFRHADIHQHNRDIGL